MAINRIQRPANQRIMDVGRNNGERNLGQQQASIITLYDSFDLNTAGTNLSFFQNAGSRNFPFTNVQQNRFSKDRTMTIARVYMSVVTVAANQITRIVPLDASAFPQFQAAELNILIGGQQVLDRFAMLSSMGPFNFSSQFGTRSISPAAGNAEVLYSNSVYQFQATPVILSDLEYVAQVTLPAYTPPAAGTTFLRLTLEGFGTLPKVVGAL
jgi:hypothetical protein